jgi:U3 small nucleolar ribonucleoprotein protein IMP4
MGMQELLEFAEGSPLIVVGEYHGNPGNSFFTTTQGSFFFPSGFGLVSEEIDSYWFPDVLPVLTGQGEIADVLESFFHFNRIESDNVSQLPSNSLLMRQEKKRSISWGGEVPF